MLQHQIIQIIELLNYLLYQLMLPRDSVLLTLQYSYIKEHITPLIFLEMFINTRPLR